MILKPKWLTKIEPGHWASKGLVGSWIFNEGGGDLAYDASGNGNHGTLVGDTHSVPGRDGPALDFDQTGDYVQKQNANILASMTSVSCVVWFNTDFSSLQTLLEYGATSGLTSGVWFGVGASQGGETRVYFYLDNVSNFVGNIQPPSFNDGWHQLAATYDGATVRYYLDGIEGDSDPGSGVITPSGTDISIGATGGTLLFSGQIGSGLIYNRALIGREIYSLYLNPYQMFKRNL